MVNYFIKSKIQTSIHKRFNWSINLIFFKIIIPKSSIWFENYNVIIIILVIINIWYLLLINIWYLILINIVILYLLYIIIKQFGVRNCSKELPGSIVTEALKNGTPKGLDFYADFKHISFIKFSLTNQKLWAWENLPYFRKKGETPLFMKITPSDSTVEISSSYLQKYEILYFWQKKDLGCVFTCFFVVVFYQGWLYRPSDPRISREGSF